jgi:DNA-binding response OmpR family regulator
MIGGTSRLPRRVRVRSFAAAAAIADGQPPGVLVVDDDYDVLDVVGEALTARGYRVLGARDGIDAMEDRSRYVAGFGPLSSVDVLITDLIMPQVSGLKLLRHIRENGWLTSVIVVSAFADHDLWAQALELGANAVLHKPFYLDELLDIVQRLAPVDLTARGGAA